MRALDRLVTILEAVAADPGSLSVTQIASRADLSLPTASRLVHDLSDQRLLERLADGTYRIGSRLLAIARLGDRQVLVELAVPVMRDLVEQTGETVSLHIRSGAERVCVAEVQSPQPVRRVVPVGLALPLHYGATGEVLLAGLEGKDLDAYLAGLDSGLDRGELRRHLDAIRAQGWTMAVDAWTEGVSGIASPVRAGGSVAASLSVSGPSARWDRAAMRAAADAVVTAAKRISEVLAASVR
jgi:DNA-binding IclR family transcriptional regulator